MDIKFFKPTYHELFTLLTDAHQQIDRTFTRGAPEGPPVLQEVYELQMDLRVTTVANPAPGKIKQVLNSVLDYLAQTKPTPAINTLKDKIGQYLVTI